MNPLHLTGYGVKITVEDLKSLSALKVTNGREDERKSYSMRFRPRKFPYTSVVVEGHSGYVSLRAFDWLSKNRIPVFMMNFNGRLISSVLPRQPIRPALLMAQFEGARNPQTKFEVAKAIIQGKVARSVQVLEWLSEIKNLTQFVDATKTYIPRLENAEKIQEVNTVEMHVAKHYWKAFAKLIPSGFEFYGRHGCKPFLHPINASDCVNTALNYGYGFLEGECMKAINNAGLEPTIGFLHEFTANPRNYALANDLKEPFRWLVDLTVMEMFTNNILETEDFYFTGDDYRYRFTQDARRRFVHHLKEHFKTKFQSHPHNWDVVMGMKAIELGQFLMQRTKEIDFVEPAPILERTNVPMEVTA